MATSKKLYVVAKITTKGAINSLECYLTAAKAQRRMRQLWKKTERALKTAVHQREPLLWVPGKKSAVDLTDPKNFRLLVKDGVVPDECFCFQYLEIPLEAKEMVIHG